MALKTYKPTSPGQRQRKSVPYRELLSQGNQPKKSLRKRVKSHAGRNNHGRITVRHKEQGHKKLYREVDFKQDKVGVVGRVKTIEYDPYRSAFISLISYVDGDWRYILSPKELKVGDNVVTEEKAKLSPGNRLALKNIPIGYFVHNVELRPGTGGRVARSAGSFVEVLGSANGYTDIRLSSKEVRRVPSDCFASVGQISNPEHNLVNLGKAGRSRWLGIRPTVRGTAMNPVDHPYGGGEGVQPRGTKRPKTLWGKVTGGRKTRKGKKWSSKFIVSRRNSKKNK